MRVGHELTNFLYFFLLIFPLILYTMKYNLLLCGLIFVVVLFMVLRDDTINQTMLVPMDLRNLIPEDHPCYFIKNVVDQIDCSKRTVCLLISRENLRILVNCCLD